MVPLSDSVGVGIMPRRSDSCWALRVRNVVEMAISRYSQIVTIMHRGTGLHTQYNFRCVWCDTPEFGSSVPSPLALRGSMFLVLTYLSKRCCICEIAARNFQVLEARKGRERQWILSQCQSQSLLLRIPAPPWVGLFGKRAQCWNWG